MHRNDDLATSGHAQGTPGKTKRRPRQPPKSLFQRLLERLGLRRKGHKKKNDPNIYPLY